MATITRKHLYTVDLNKPLTRQSCGILLAEGDNNGDCFSFTLVRDGVAVYPGGALSVTAYFIRQDGNTVMKNGNCVSNVVDVTLPQSCYTKEGRFSLAVKVTQDGVTATVAVFDGYVKLTGTDNIVDPEETIVDINNLLETITSDLANNKTLIDNVSENVPIVKVAEQPTFVNSIDECKDTSKMYVLPDGMIYAYILTETETATGGYKNWLPLATETYNGTTIYGGKGYSTGYRLSSSGSVSAQSGMLATGYIPASDGAVIRTVGFAANGASMGCYVITYDANGTKLKHYQWGSST